jgi:hypothetical protein
MLRSTVLALAILAVAAPSGFAQETTPPAVAAPTVAAHASTLSELLATPGLVLIRDFYDLGRVNGMGRVNLQAIVVNEVGREGERGRGMRFEIVDAEKADLSQWSTLDLTELDALAAGLDAMRQLSQKWRGVDKREYSEVEFSSKDGLRIGFYQRGREQGGFVAAGTSTTARAFLDMGELEKLRTMILRGMSLLNSK